MELEQPIAEASTPQIVPVGDSMLIKKQHGGKRPGAGRKPNLTKILLKGVSRQTILAACENVDVGAVIIGLLRSKREQSRIEALHFIFDRIMGKPKQDVSVSGGIIHTHTRDPFLVSLPKEALEELLRANNEILAKYSTQVFDVAQDGPHNQVKSTVGIEAAESRLTAADGRVREDGYHRLPEDLER